MPALLSSIEFEIVMPTASLSAVPAFNYTQEQFSLISHNGGNALCSAGAGTGKTSTLVGFLEQQLKVLPSEQICVLMFNSETSRDFVSKLGERAVNGAQMVNTYHAFCKKILNESGYLQENGYSLSFNEREAMSIIRDVLKKQASDPRYAAQKSTLLKPNTRTVAAGFIGLVKANALTPKEVLHNYKFNRDYAFLTETYNLYEQARKHKKVLFFDDWLVAAVALLSSDSEFQETIRESYQLIVVDEFQDINAVQYQLLQLIKGADSSLVVVGDVDQSIYGWRGSEPGFMLNFSRDFSPCTKYRLSETFRYGHALAISAYQLISNNRQRESDFITSSSEHVEKTDVCVISDKAFVSRTVKNIRAQLAEGTRPSEIAILIRRWSQTMLLEIGLLKANIAYQMPAVSALKDSKEINLLRAVIAIMQHWSLQTPNMPVCEAFRTVLSYPSCYIKQSAVNDLADLLAGCSLTDYRQNIKNFSGRSSMDSKSLNKVSDRLQWFAKHHLEKSAFTLFAGYRQKFAVNDWLKNSEATESDYEENIDRLDAVATILRTLKLSTEQALQFFQHNEQAANRANNSEDAVKITTIFRAKGAEFDYVHLPFWNAGDFPSVRKKSSVSVNDIQEQRRLAYVGLTRAKKGAFIYHSPQQYGNRESGASRFVKEVDINRGVNVAQAVHLNHSLPEKMSEKIQRYLLKIGRITEIKPVVTSRIVCRQTERRKPAPIRNVMQNKAPALTAGKEVIHIDSGRNGKIIECDRVSFRVEFDDKSSDKYLSRAFSNYFKHKI
ncbi:ATP-dependent helicase [Psychromonas aquimarina]|uniref:ATP-dependent helicase n=1 Tax=Psychromonas aquimarina TaxID=444919 RepID=UPI0004045EFD|nr:ATP-dependent helicase [Psychromonas aquimarina]